MIDLLIVPVAFVVTLVVTFVVNLVAFALPGILMILAAAYFVLVSVGIVVAFPLATLCAITGIGTLVFVADILVDVVLILVGLLVTIIVIIIIVIIFLLQLLYNMFIFLFVIPLTALVAAIQATAITSMFVIVAVLYFTVTLFFHWIIMRSASGSQQRKERMGLLVEFTKIPTNLLVGLYTMFKFVATPLIRVLQLILIAWDISVATAESSAASALSVLLNTIGRPVRGWLYLRLSMIKEQGLTEDLVGAIHAKGAAQAGNVAAYQIFGLFRAATRDLASLWLAVMSSPIYVGILIKTKYDAWVMIDPITKQVKRTLLEQKVRPQGPEVPGGVIWESSTRSSEGRRISEYWKKPSKLMKLTQPVWHFWIAEHDPVTMDVLKDIKSWVGRTTVMTEKGGAETKWAFAGSALGGGSAIGALFLSGPIMIPIMLIIFFLIFMAVLGAPVVVIILVALFIACAIVLFVAVLVGVGVVVAIGAMLIVSAALMCVMLPAATYAVGLTLSIVFIWIPVVGEIVAGMVMPVTQFLVTSIELPLCKLILRTVIKMVGGNSDGNVMQQVTRLIKFGIHTQISMILRLVTFDAGAKAVAALRDESNKKSRQLSMKWVLAQRDALCAEALATEIATKSLETMSDERQVADKVVAVFDDNKDKGRRAFVSGMAALEIGVTALIESQKGEAAAARKLADAFKKEVEKSMVPKTFSAKAAYRVSEAMASFAMVITWLSIKLEFIMDVLLDQVPAFMITRFQSLMYYQKLAKGTLNMAAVVEPTVETYKGKMTNAMADHAETIAAAAEFAEKVKEQLGDSTALEFEDEQGNIVIVDINVCPNKQGLYDSRMFMAERRFKNV